MTAAWVVLLVRTGSITPTGAVMVALLTWVPTAPAVARSRSVTLPLTGKAVVDRIITDLAVMDVTRHGLIVVELAPGVTREFLQSKTGVTLI